jgi:hypothetical protein
LLEDSDILELANGKEKDEPVLKKSIASMPIKYSAKSALEGLDNCFLCVENLANAQEEDIEMLFK